jgi:hypothetical protein
MELIAMPYAKDPRFIIAKFAGTDTNGQAFGKGARVFYYPSTKTIIAGEAAAQAARDFEAAKSDEGG